LVVRHGVRYPSQKQALEAWACLESLKLQVKGMKSILFEIENTFIDKQDYGLTKLGGMETRQIANCFKHRYPEIFSKLRVEEINFKSSSKTRSIESETNFTRILFDHEDIDLKIDDDMLLGFDNCKNYIRQMNLNNKSLKKEIEFFKATKHVHKLLGDFKKRLFIRSDYNVRIGNSRLKQKFFCFFFTFKK
jgi:hypothetical protein